MDDLRLGSLFRAVRIRRGWRQAEVADRARVGTSSVSRLERGQLGRCSLDLVRRVASVLEIRIDLTGRWRGADGDRVLSGRHSQLSDIATRMLSVVGWDPRLEVSFSIYGERGFIDLLAWHAADRALLVIEIKTEIVDVGELLGTLDRKRRLASQVAKGLGWEPASVSACVLLAENRTNHRRVADHAAILRAALPADGRTLRAWLRRPRGSLAALAFLPFPLSLATRPGGRGLKRVRRRPARATRPDSSVQAAGSEAS